MVCGSHRLPPSEIDTHDLAEVKRHAWLDRRKTTRYNKRRPYPVTIKFISGTKLIYMEAYVISNCDRANDVAVCVAVFLVFVAFIVFYAAATLLNI